MVGILLQGICYKGYMNNKTDIETCKAKKHWIFVRIFYDIKEGNIGYLSTKNIKKNNIIFYCDIQIGLRRGDTETKTL